MDSDINFIGYICSVKGYFLNRSLMGFNVDTYIKQHVKDGVILDVRGNIDSDVINKILDTVEDRMISSDELPKLRKKVYNVLVESLQNLYHHVDEVPKDFYDQEAERFGVVVIQKLERGYRIVTGNFVHVEHLPKLEERLQRINKSTFEEIKELYKFILNHQRISDKGGGGLGLVDIAKKTGRKLNYTFEKYNDEYCFFYMNIVIDDSEEGQKW
jgi:hypothetical protein